MNLFTFFDSSLPLRIKAPNDIYLGDGKLSGLLVEVTQKGQDFFVYVGLGLNVTDAPNIDIPTSSLEEHCPDFKSQWPDFCKFLYNQFLMAMEKGKEKNITEDDCDDLLEALNAGLEESEQYTKVSPRCDLHSAKGVTPWFDL